MKDTVEQHRAWKRMLEKRTCPPVDIIAGGGQAVERHLKACASCRRRAAFAAAASRLSSAMPYREPEPGEIAGRAGEVRRLLRKAADGNIRDESGWHNPPLVLLLSPVPGTEGLFLVAQIHDAPELSFAGDVPLDGEMEGCFAESWNTFEAFVDAMAPPLAVVADETLNRVLESGGEAFEPEPLSVLESFRNQEEAVGSFFGALASARSRAMEERDEAVCQARTSSFGGETAKAKGRALTLWTSLEAREFVKKYVAEFCRSEEYASRSRVSDRLLSALSSAACASASLPRMPKRPKAPVPSRVASFIESVAGFAVKPLLRKGKGSGKKGTAVEEAPKEALRIGTSFVVPVSLDEEPAAVREIDLAFLPEGDGSMCVAWASGIPPASYSALRVFAADGRELAVSNFKADGDTLLLRLSCKPEDVGNSHLFMLAERAYTVGEASF